MGGLSRRAYILNKIRKEESKPIVVVDAGALLFPQPSIASSLFSAQTVQAGGLLEAMAEMGTDAAGLAPQDLAAGSDFLLQQPAGKQLPWLSINLVQETGEKPLFTPYLIKKAGDLSIGIIGLTDQLKNSSNHPSVKDYRTIPWEVALQSTLEQIKDRTDMIILLSSFTEQTNREIAEKFRDIHLIIQSGHSTNNKNPQLVGNALITQVDSRGKHLGRLDIDWKPSHRWQPSPAVGAKPTRDRLDRINWQIGRLEKRYSTSELETNPQHEKLLKEKDKLTAELRAIEAQNEKSPVEFSTYAGSVIGLPVSLPEVPEIREIVLRTKLAVNKTNQGALAKASQQSPQANQQPFSNLAGWQACQSCHKPQTEFWQQTAHAKAWQTLEKVNQQFNPECLICHVTLPTYDRETVIRQGLLAGLKDEFKTIGCETCHGPAKDHTLQPTRYIPEQPDEQRCLLCHTPERDDNFIYDEKLEKIRCPASGH